MQEIFGKHFWRTSDYETRKRVQPFWNIFLAELISFWWELMLDYNKVFFSGKHFFQSIENCLVDWYKTIKAKTFAALPNWPWKHKIFAGLIISSKFVLFDDFYCFKEQASFHRPTKSPLFQWLILSRILWALLRLSFCSLLLTIKKHLYDPNPFFLV